MSRIVQFLDFIGHEVPPGARAGASAKMRCPFHDDANPSAKVYPETDTIHCFTCNKTWTVETAWMTKFGVYWTKAAAETAKLFPGGFVTDFAKADTSLLRRYSTLTPAAVNDFARYLKLKVLRLQLGPVWLKQIDLILQSNQSLEQVFLNLKSISDALEV